MLASFIRWWIARMSELLPEAWMHAFSFKRTGILIVNATLLTAVVRIRGKSSNVTMSDAARMARRMPVTLNPPPNALLVKRHSVPAMPRHDLDQLLKHELSRITPFTADALFWKWEGCTNPRDRTRMDIILTMVPKAAVCSAIATLAKAGIEPDYLEVGSLERSAVLPLFSRKGRRAVLQSMMYICAGLSVAVVVLPVLLQAIALYRIESKLTRLQPAVIEATSLREALSAGGAAEELIRKEVERNDDLLRVLAMVTQVLPDDTSLVDLSLRDRQLAISGRTVSAPRLITGLAVSQGIREPAFAAPVTRIEGAPLDAFQIKARLTH